MKTSAGMFRAPFLGTVEAKVCGCKQAPKELFTARSLERAIANITGYWSIYLTFFGDQIVWLEFTIVDTRDGVVMWRNGRPTQEEPSNGAGHGTAGEDLAEWDGKFSRWVVSKRPLSEPGSRQAERSGW